jgi:hypothetical protein
VPGVSSLKLRAAWGQAGNAPGPLDAARTYTTSVVTDSNGTSSALRYGSPGNPDLRPERGSEIEVGFESTLLGDRVGLARVGPRRRGEVEEAEQRGAVAPAARQGDLAGRLERLVERERADAVGVVRHAVGVAAVAAEEQAA